MLLWLIGNFTNNIISISVSQSETYFLVIKQPLDSGCTDGEGTVDDYPSAEEDVSCNSQDGKGQNGK